MFSTRKLRVGTMRWVGLCLLAALPLWAGCGEKGGVHLNVDPELARRSLTTFLETWNRGESRESLEKGSPRIVGRDPLWDSGQKLTEFKIGKESSDGANLHIEVELRVAAKGNASGAASAQTVTYVVGTSPVITVFRNE